MTLCPLYPSRYDLQLTSRGWLPFLKCLQHSPYVYTVVGFIYYPPSATTLMIFNICLVRRGLSSKMLIFRKHFFKKLRVMPARSHVYTTVMRMTRMRGKFLSALGMLGMILPSITLLVWTYLQIRSKVLWFHSNSKEIFDIR